MLNECDDGHRDRHKIGQELSQVMRYTSKNAVLITHCFVGKNMSKQNIIQFVLEVACYVRANSKVNEKLTMLWSVSGYS